MPFSAFYDFPLQSLAINGIIFFMDTKLGMIIKKLFKGIAIWNAARPCHAGFKLVCDGFCSSLAAFFGCTPNTSYSQNVGLVAMTKVVNRFTIATGASVPYITCHGYSVAKRG